MTARADVAHRDAARPAPEGSRAAHLIDALESCLALVQRDAEAQVAAIEADTQRLERRCHELRSELERAAPSGTVVDSPEVSSSEVDSPDVASPEAAKSLLVNGFPWEAGKEALLCAFAPFGAESAHIAHKDGRPRLGFINFDSPRDAAMALAACRKQEVLVDDRKGRGWPVKAEWQRSPTGGRRKRRGSGGILKDVTGEEL
jgi:hypothetical protein